MPIVVTDNVVLTPIQVLEALPFYCPCDAYQALVTVTLNRRSSTIA